MRSADDILLSCDACASVRVRMPQLLPEKTSRKDAQEAGERIGKPFISPINAVSQTDLRYYRKHLVERLLTRQDGLLSTFYHVPEILDGPGREWTSNEWPIRYC